MDTWREAKEIINSSHVKFKRADEPILIVPKGIFPFNTKFSYFGQDKTSFMAELYMANYSFNVFAEIYAVYIGKDAENSNGWLRQISTV